MQGACDRGGGALPRRTPPDGGAAGVAARPPIPRQRRPGGVDTTPDGRTLFVGIQHPGENGTVAAPSSHWPDTQATGTAGATVRPRSAIVAITKTDGGVVGL